MKAVTRDAQTKAETGPRHFGARSLSNIPEYWKRFPTGNVGVLINFCDITTPVATVQELFFAQGRVVRVLARFTARLKLYHPGLCSTNTTVVDDKP